MGLLGRRRRRGSDDEGEGVGGTGRDGAHAGIAGVEAADEAVVDGVPDDSPGRDARIAPQAEGDREADSEDGRDELDEPSGVGEDGGDGAVGEGDPDLGEEEDTLEIDELPDGLEGIQLSHWSTDARRMLDGLFEARGLGRAWQGGYLVVRNDDMEQAERLIADVEFASAPRLDEDEEKLVYEVAEWPIDTQSQLAEQLVEQAIDHEWDASGDLVVLASAEDAVDEIFDGIDLPEGDVESDSQAASGEPLPDANEVITELFLAADRLRKSARNADGVLGLIPAARSAEQIRLPFGFEAIVWKDLITRASALATLLEDDASDDEEIVEMARDLHRQLGQYV